MCLVGFASLQSPWAHTLKASLPCLLLPLHRPSPFLQPLQKNTYHLSCLYLPLHQPLHPHNLLKSTSIASPRTTTLAPLAEGEVLSPEKIRATTRGIVAPPTFPKPHYPLLCTITLASLVKGEVLLPKKFGRLPEGSPYHHPSPLTNPPKTALPLEKRYHSCHMNALLVSHPCETLGVQLRASMPVPCQR